MLSTLTGRLILIVAIVVIAFLQFKLWMGEGGYRERQRLASLIQQQNQQNDQLAERNRVLSAEVHDLKDGMEAVEEHARLDLGLIRPHETFVQLTALPPPVIAAPAPPAS
ncbi:cell division protein FtsB [Aquirhabdus parva]|uniref:Cell division protein FtsB n=1 Tax=Aquirhabdus parva TaxID=2283318 RepID=A0A345P4H3_9GAMM|nr:cell division protein FtsB [Aquirhabdus parva]AXI02182.1 cell division protein FtsB [Aquirhabdus parva]